MPRDDDARLLDMYLAARKIERFMGMSREGFLADERVLPISRE